MNVFYRRGAWIATALIGLLVAGALVAPFLLDAALPDPDRARNILGVIQPFVTVVAIGVGGVWAYFRFQVFRTIEPHLSIRHRITHRRLSDSYTHIEVTAFLHNSSRVRVELERGVALVQEVGPISDREAETLSQEALEDDADPWITWPIIGRMQRVWEYPRLVIEPAAIHSETFEFIVLTWENQSLLLYTYFYNADTQSHPETKGGWSATTVYDVVDGLGGSQAEEAANGEDA